VPRSHRPAPRQSRQRSCSWSRSTSASDDASSRRYATLTTTRSGLQRKASKRVLLSASGRRLRDWSDGAVLARRSCGRPGCACRQPSLRFLAVIQVRAGWLSRSGGARWNSDRGRQPTRAIKRGSRNSRESSSADSAPSSKNRPAGDPAAASSSRRRAPSVRRLHHEPLGSVEGAGIHIEASRD
jgi:hypothetical protein